MAYESYLEILGSAGDRQLRSPKLGLAHNLGGFYNRNVCSVTLLGRISFIE
jgi:acetyl-CoA C-acetyltransferase